MTKAIMHWIAVNVSVYIGFDLIGILGQVRYLIVSIPDLCTFTYFVHTKGKRLPYN